ncbi:MAG: alpha-glucosidase C-terminal domain-containing protein [Blastocatellia bacterium]|nr:alpha-glucosidase C-terminal domain-containing protein [Blastocatellia bacterium]
MKGANKDAYIVGEIWDPVPQMLDGKTFDAQMNYPLLRAVIRFFVDSAPRSMPSEFAKEIADLRALYPKSVVAVQQNLLDSHDTDRAVSMVVNPNRRFDAANRLQDPDGKAYDTRKPDPAAYHRLKLITIFQMTYLGAPMIWYGDEVGMFGADDPTDRKPMVWRELQPYKDPDDVVDEGMLEHYRKLLAIRNSYDALQVGEYRQVLADDATGVFAFERSHAGKRVWVVINNTDRTQWVKLPVERGSWHDALNDTRYRFEKFTRPETGAPPGDRLRPQGRAHLHDQRRPHPRPHHRRLGFDPRRRRRRRQSDAGLSRQPSRLSSESQCLRVSVCAALPTLRTQRR